MQNKGLVRILAVALTLVCLFYLSFSVVTSYYNKKAKEYANGDKAKEYYYLDSISGKNVYFNWYTLKECREKEINLGLDLKGGMNVTLEISVEDILRALSGYNTTENFNKALSLAAERQQKGQSDFLTLFVQAYTEIDPQAQLSTIFSTFELKDKISLNSTNDEVVQVLKEEIESAIDNSFNVLRMRIDRFGVVQPNIQKLDQAGRILIELPGIKEPERVRKLLQGTANLEFWETYDLSEIFNNIVQANSILASMQEATDAAESTETTAEAAQTETTAQTENGTNSVDSLLAQIGTTEETETENEEARLEWEKENPLFSVMQLSIDQSGRPYAGPVIGTVHYNDTAKVNAFFATKQVKEILPRDLRLMWTVKAIDPNETYYQLIAIKVSNRDGRAPLEGGVITNARADFSQTSSYAKVDMTMNAEGAKVWARLTKDNIGKSIAVVLDGYVYSFPTVRSEITGGRSEISGNFTVEEAKDLANTLNSGKMPAPARIVQEDIVGPSLGQEAITSGLISFVIAFCLVLIYMMLYYGFIPGLIADTALFANVFFLLGILASFSAVLTLPGIAGIVLTLGMAVDTNVLIYERIREEMNAGKNMKKAIVDGYSNAISAIVDANLTTMITGIVLAIFGTGPIKGFAVTLIIGLITSFITGVFLTRLLLENYANRKNAKELPFTTNVTKNWFQNLNINFIGKRKAGYTISAILIILSILGLIPQFFGNLNYGIDFSGGRNYVIRFQEPVQTEEIRELLEDEFDGVNVQVITIGSDNQVRVSTKFGIDSQSETIDDEIEARLYNGLKEKIGENVSLEEFKDTYILSSQKVGPTIADDIKTSAIWAIIFSLIAIGLYIFIRFRNVAFSLGTLASLVHDTIIILGMYALLWRVMPFSMEIDQSFIAAILTIIGYSVNDTVVIFDRIRENVTLYPKRDRKQIINESLNQTLSRTFSTSMSTFVVLIAIFCFGGETIRGFVFAMLLGVVLGTYSTLFVAVPIAYDTLKKKLKKEEAIVEKK